jgi:hypothetical protein
MQMKPFLIVTLAFLTLAVFEPRIQIDHNLNRVANRDFKFDHLPSPSKDDDAAKAKLTLIDGTIDPNSADLSALTDGLLPSDQDDPSGNLFFNSESMGGRFRMDFVHPLDIVQVLTYSWHPNVRGPQLYKLYAANGTEPGFNIAPKRGVDPATCGWKFIITVSTIPKEGEEGGQYVASVSDSTGSLGKYRYLLFDCYVTELYDSNGNTFYSEIDVIGK